MNAGPVTERLNEPSRLLHPASRVEPDRPLPAEAIRQIATGLASVPREPVLLASGEVVRHRLLTTPVYDAWEVSLGPGAAIAPHDHDGSLGVIAVAEGSLIEERLGDADTTRTLRLVREGDVVEVGPTERHELRNNGLESVVTVQVFSPPLGD